MEKVVITGGSGFLGSNLIKYLISKNKSVSVVLRRESSLINLEDVMNEINIFIYDNKIEELVQFFKDVRPDKVFHLASNFIAEHETSQVDALVQSNILFGLHLLEAMKVANVKKMVNTGTSWQHYNNEPYNPVCLYAATKEAYEKLIEYYVVAEGFSVVTLKLYDTYGENDKRPKLINLLHKFADEKIELNMSPGEQLLNLVHVSDVCEAFLVSSYLLDNIQGHKIYSVPSKESHKLKDLVSLFERVTGKKVVVNWGGKHYRNREVMTLWDKGKTLPNWQPKITLEEGLKLY